MDEVIRNQTIKFVYRNLSITPPTGINHNVALYALMIVSFTFLIFV